MAKLIPEVSVTDIITRSERDVAVALTDLPDEFLVFHSYPWIRNNGTRLYKGEIDFLIFNRKTGGLLVLEVKGGAIGYEPVSGRWYSESNKKYLIKNPFEQASESMFTIASRIKKSVFPTLDHIPFPHGYAVVFPDCDYTGDVPPGADRSILFTWKDLPRLGKGLISVLDAWSGKPQIFSPDNVAKIREAILPEFKLIPVASRRVAQDEEVLLRLTEQQQIILDMLANRPQALVEGVAGSGKTLLAMEQAKRFAAQGRRVLLTCYNKRLAEWLSKSVPEQLKNNIKIRHFHGLAYDLCRAAEIEFSIPENEDEADKYWRQQIPEMMLVAASSQSQLFDAIVVDEGQDFLPEWWGALHCLNDGGPEGKFYVFYDPAQNLYSGAQFKPPLDSKPYPLPHNCRNTRLIAGHCSEIIKTEIKLHQHAPTGVPCEIKTVADEVAAVHTLQQTLNRLLHEGMKSSQIAILSPHKRAETLLKGKQKVGTGKITGELEKWYKNEAVLFETIRSFKGLEADAIILYALPAPDENSHFTQADYYVASSRAKHILQVIEVKGNSVNP